MTLAEIKDQVMFQTNNDPEDIEDFLPHAEDYINDGYDRIVYIWDHQHVPCTDYPRLTEETDEPNLPEWMHRYLCDWATWLVYRNGNPQKQSRGHEFQAHFLSLLSQIADSGGKDGLNEDGSQKRYRNFINIPR